MWFICRLVQQTSTEQVSSYGLSSTCRPGGSAVMGQFGRPLKKCQTMTNVANMFLSPEAVAPNCDYVSRGGRITKSVKLEFCWSEKSFDVKQERRVGRFSIENVKVELLKIWGEGELLNLLLEVKLKPSLGVPSQPAIQFLLCPDMVLISPPHLPSHLPTF